MRTPYVVEGDFVSLDAGAMNYAPGQEVEIRCRLKRDDGSPLANAEVKATLTRNGQAAAVVALTEDPKNAGSLSWGRLVSWRLVSIQ